MIGVSTKTVDRLRRRGELPSAHIEGCVRLPRQGVIDYVDRLFNLADPKAVADAPRVCDPLVPELSELRARKSAEADRQLGRAA
jgi:hypothetical protein